MTEVSNEVVTVESNGKSVTTARDQIANINADTATIFSTIKTDSLAEKMELFTALTNAEQISDHLGETINLKHIVAQVVEVGQEDGTMSEAVRTILIAEDGTAYAGVSAGLFKALENLLQVLGTPETWGNAAIPIQVVEAKSRKGFKFFTVKVA